MTDNKTHSKDDVLHVAHCHSVEADEHDLFDRPNISAFHRRTASMLRAYAEVVDGNRRWVSKDELSEIFPNQRPVAIARVISGYEFGDHGPESRVAWIYNPMPEGAELYELTAALSTRGG